MQHTTDYNDRLKKHFCACRTALAIGIALVTLAILNCSTLGNKIAGSDVSNEDVISISGKVLLASGKDTTAVAGVVAKITDRFGNLVLQDTTNISGFYQISVETREYQAKNLDTNQLKKAVVFYRNDTLITQKSFTTWIDTLAPILIVTRDVNCKFLQPIGITDTVRVFVQFTSTQNDTSSYWQQAWYNRVDTSTSTLVQFRYNGEMGYFSTYVAVFNNIGRLVGRSVTVSDITKNAGDIHIPSFDPHNATPHVNAGLDTTVISIDTMVLHATIVDDFGDRKLRFKWECLENKKLSDSSGTNPLYITAPLTTTGSVLHFVLSATDDDGNSARDTLAVTIRSYLPKVSLVADTIFSCADTIKLQAKTDEHTASITQWAWDIGGTGLFTTTPTPLYTGQAPSVPQNNLPCIIRATDKWSLKIFDTIYVDIAPLPTLTAVSSRSQLSVPDNFDVTVKATGIFDSMAQWDIQVPDNIEPVDTTIVGPLERIFSFRVNNISNDTVLCKVRITDVVGKTVAQQVSGRYLNVYSVTHDTTSRGCVNFIPANDVHQALLAQGSIIRRVDIAIGLINNTPTEDSITLIIQTDVSILFKTTRLVRKADLPMEYLTFDKLNVSVTPGHLVYVGLHDTNKVLFGWYYGPNINDNGYMDFFGKKHPEWDLDCRVFFSP